MVIVLATIWADHWGLRSVPLLVIIRGSGLDLEIQLLKKLFSILMLLSYLIAAVLIQSIGLYIPLVLSL